MLYIHIYAVYNELNEGINHAQWNNGNECARLLHETNEEMHLIIHEEREQKENVLLRELFTKRTLC